MVYENSSFDDLFDELFAECSYPRVQTPEEILRQLLVENNDEVDENLNDYDTAAERIREIFR